MWWVMLANPLTWGTRHCLSWKQVDDGYMLDYLKGEMSFCLCNLLSRLPLIRITFWFNVYAIMKLFLSLLVLWKLSGNNRFSFNCISPTTYLNHIIPLITISSLFHIFYNQQITKWKHFEVFLGGKENISLISMVKQCTYAEITASNFFKYITLKDTGNIISIIVVFTIFYEISNSVLLYGFLNYTI